MRRQKIVSEMGSPERIARQHAKGRMTIRERLDRLFDAGSFREIGTFAHSEMHEVRDRTPGDGKIGGWGTIDGRAATAVGDDVTVLHGSSSVVGGKRMKRIYEQSLLQGVPHVYFGETGGARFARCAGDRRASARFRRGLSRLGDGGGFRWRRRSWGSRSAAPASIAPIPTSRFRCGDRRLNVSSPRVIEIATGELISLQDPRGTSIFTWTSPARSTSRRRTRTRRSG